MSIHNTREKRARNVAVLLVAAVAFCTAAVLIIF